MLPMLLGAIGGPLLQGALTGTALGALTATQLGAGIAGLTSLAQGNDILTAGLDAFGGYGGAGAVSNLAKTGAAASGALAPTVSAVQDTGALLGSEALNNAGTVGKLTSFAPNAASAASAPFSLSNVGSGIQDLLSPGGAQRFADITKESALSSVGVPAAGAVLGLAGMGPQQMAAPEQDLGFGPFTPVSEIRSRNEKLGYADGGIAALNPMHNQFDARTALPEYREPLGNFKKGGYLDGPGDGMSDSIPATIEGMQPARLADGEFVVPADVVSHLGNGSTKAGAQRLYSMMDKVRKARTGSTKQGKQIKPEKYMPA